MNCGVPIRASLGHCLESGHGFGRDAGIKEILGLPYLLDTRILCNMVVGLYCESEKYCQKEDPGVVLVCTQQLLKVISILL